MAAMPFPCNGEPWGVWSAGLEALGFSGMLTVVNVKVLMAYSTGGGGGGTCYFKSRRLTYRLPGQVARVKCN